MSTANNVAIGMKRMAFDSNLHFDSYVFSASRREILDFEMTAQLVFALHFQSPA